VIVIAAGAFALSLLYSPSDSTGTDRDLPVSPEPEYIIPDSVSIRVLNGAGINDLARTVQRYLSRQGTPSVFYAPEDPSNADRMNYEYTVVVSHLEDLTGAVLVARELGLTEGSVVWQVPVEGSPPVDVTLYLGQDMAEGSFAPYSN
jgi:hypothetical protein